MIFQSIISKISDKFFESNINNKNDNINIKKDMSIKICEFPDLELGIVEEDLDKEDKMSFIKNNKFFENCYYYLTIPSRIELTIYFLKKTSIININNSDNNIELHNELINDSYIIDIYE